MMWLYMLGCYMMFGVFMFTCMVVVETARYVVAHPYSMDLHRAYWKHLTERLRSSQSWFAKVLSKLKFLFNVLILWPLWALWWLFCLVAGVRVTDVAVARVEMYLDTKGIDYDKSTFRRRS